MIDKIAIALAGLSLTYANPIVAMGYYTSVQEVPSVEVYHLINNGPGTRRVYPSVPAPIYEDNTDDIPNPIYDKPQQRQLITVLNNPYPRRRSGNIVNIGSLNSHDIQNRVLFQSACDTNSNNRITDPVTITAHTASSPLVNSYSGPVLGTRYGYPVYPTHDVPVTNQPISFSKAPSLNYNGYSSSYNSY